MLTKETITQYFKNLQDDICRHLETIDGTAEFQEDQWTRAGGGGGRSRIILGDLIEKGGVNFSAVHGELPEKISAALNLPPSKFYATGVSIVLHPKSPMMPIIHKNIRYFEMDNGTYWFGGGIDLTPHYINKEDAIFFHQSLKKACDQHQPDYYPTFKKWADDYFFIKHRNETRGIGGIFFDHLKETEAITKQDRFDFVKSVGEAFCPIYTHLAEKNRALPYGEPESDWQLLRRSRYVEFNLVWDKGTKFGLDTDGRTESILMSMPPLAKWVYAHEAAAGSREAETLDLLRKGIEWV